MFDNKNCAPYKTARFSVFFGNKINGLEAQRQRGNDEQEEVNVTRLTQILSSENNLFLKRPVLLLQQTHGTTIRTLNSLDDYQALSLRSSQGDSLITTVPQTAIGILTADCLPIIVYNNYFHALAVIHVGWKGIMQEMIKKTLEVMTSTSIDSGAYSVILGPSARKCCYEVGKEFFDYVPQTHHDSIEQRNGTFYFDLPTYAAKELMLCGISPSVLFTKSLCTICTPTFYSHRREGSTLTKRQATIAILHDQL